MHASECLYSLILVGFLFCINYTSGKIFFKMLEINFPNFFFEVFLCNLFGCTLLVTVYSFSVILFNTIFWIYLPLLLLFVFFQITDKKDGNIIIENGVKRKDVILMLCALTMVVSYNFFGFYDSSSPFGTSQLTGDYVFYSKISKCLTYTKQENIYNILNEVNYEKYSGNVLYHYFDLWLNNFVSLVSPFTNFVTYKTVIFPYFHLLIMTALLGLIKIYIGDLPVYISFFVVIILLLFGSLDYNIESLQIYHLSLSCTDKPKLLVYTIFYLGILIALIDKRYLLALVLFQFLALAYSVSLPSILLTICTLPLVKYLLKKCYTIDYSFKNIYLMAAMFVVLIIIFSKVTKTPEVTSQIKTLSIQNIISTFSFASDARTMINIIIGSFFFVALMYFLPLVWLVVKRKKVDAIEKFFVVWVFIICIVNICLWAVLYKDLNGWQLFHNTSVPLLNICLLFVILLIYNRSTTKIKVATSAIVLAVALINCKEIYDYWHYCPINKDQIEYYSKVKKVVDSGLVSNPIGVVLMGSKDFTDIFSRNQTNNFGDFLFVYKDNYFCVGLSDYEMKFSEIDPLTKLRQENGFKIGFYRKYLENAISEKDYPFKSLDKRSWEHQWYYIVKNNISYAFVSDNFPNKDKVFQLSDKAYYNATNKTWFILFNKKLVNSKL